MQGAGNGDSPGEGAVPAPATREPAPAGPVSALRRLDPEQLVPAALVVLSLVGIGIADFSSRSGLNYWLWMVPVFGGASLYAGWSRARREGQGMPRILTLQILHWSPLVLAIYVIYLLERTGRLQREDAGLVVLLALALTTFLAGVHFEWRLGVLGLLLAAAAVSAALVDQFFWLLLLPGLVVVVVILVWRRRPG